MAWPASAADPKPDPAPVPAKPQPAEPAPSKQSPTTPAPAAPAPSEPAPSPPAAPSAPAAPSHQPESTTPSGASASGFSQASAAAAKKAAARKAEAAARARAAEAARAKDVVALRIQRARTLHELHERPFGLALARVEAIAVPFEPPVAALPAIPDDGDAPLVGPRVLFALTGVACVLILLAGLPDALITSVGQVGILLERGRGILLIGGAEILFGVAVIILIGGRG